MPLSLRYAQILLLVDIVLTIVAACSLALLAGASQAAIPMALVLVVVFALAVTVYAFSATVMGLERADAWAPVTAFWALALIVLADFLGILQTNPGEPLPLPVFGILAVVGIIALPSRARTFIPRDDRLPPTRLMVAYVILLILTLPIPGVDEYLIGR